MAGEAGTESWEVGACWECGYSLRGLPSNRCPECGRPFDPADETTMNMGVAVGALARRLMQPPGWALHVFTALAVVASLWAAATPTGPGAFVDELSHSWVFTDNGLSEQMLDLWEPGARFLWGAVVWAAVIGLWVVRRVARGVTVWRLSRHKAATFAYWRRWLVTPVVFGLTVLLCTTRLPTLAGFWLSKPWIERAAERGPAGASADGPRYRWIGVYPTDRKAGRDTVRQVKGQTWVCLWERSGFVRCDPGVRPDERGGLPDWTWGHVTFQQVAPNWYSYRLISWTEP